MSFVPDNSVVCGWLVASQSTAYGESIAKRLQNSRAVAPQAQKMLAMLGQWPIAIDTAAPSPAQVFDLALRYEQSTCDAFHLDRALRRSLPLATQDRALAFAALSAGVGLVQGGSL